jgi:hypothetical protein
VTQIEAMLLTFAVEALVAAVLAIPFRLAPHRCALAAVAGSAVTHPILWAIFYDVDDVLGALTTPTLEFAIIAAESIAYRALATRSWTEALLLSLLANAASWGAGEAIYALT